MQRIRPRFDWPPDYTEQFAWRAQQLHRIRSDPKLLYGALEFYKTHPIEFIEHWGVTVDPRNATSSLPTQLPFILFPKQKELVYFLQDCLKDQQSGLVEKSRDMGATWLCCAFSVWLWLFYPGTTIGWCSRILDLVDKIGVPDTIFEKMRIFIKMLPPEFLPQGFNQDDHLSYKRLINPASGAVITGEGGDNVGRGGRNLIYFKDESSHYEHPEAVEAGLTNNTNCQIDISSVNATGNVFYRKREAGVEWYPGAELPKGKVRVFVMDWRDNPAKTPEWYASAKQEYVDRGLQHVWAQEVDRNYSAAVTGTIIPADWVKAAIDAHTKLGFKDDGRWCAALDVADEGGDTNALAKRKGIILKSIEEWGERDVGLTARRAVAGCRDLGEIELQYDCIGVGAAVKAETNRLADESLLPKQIMLVPWNAGAGVLYPEKNVIPGDKKSPLNEDFYANLKAQAWWSIRNRFELTYRAITEKGFTYDVDDLISLDGAMPLLQKLIKELSQPTIGYSSRLKLLVNKTPEGTRSPNLADAVIMCFWPVPANRPMIVTTDLLRRFAASGVRA